MRPVKIHVKIFGVARLKAGIGSFETDVATLDELMDAIPGIPRKEAKDLVVLVNGRSAGDSVRAMKLPCWLRQEVVDDESKRKTLY